MIRVMIADDHEVVRTGLRAILQKEFIEISFGEAWDAPSARNQLSQGDWDVAILDLTMPGTIGFELLKELRILRPATPLIVLSFHSEDEYAVRAFRAGAAAYLSKMCAMAELGTAVNRVVQGHRYVSPGQAERIAAEIDSSTSHTALSDREYLTMCEIGAGQSIKQIAAKLGLSVKTISTYRARLLKKLGADSNADIIRHVVEHQLV